MVSRYSSAKIVLDGWQYSMIYFSDYTVLAKYSKYFLLK